jgi:hypothetical protein
MANLSSAQLACNDHIQVSLSENCYFQVNLDMLLEAPPLDTTCLIFIITDAAGNEVPGGLFDFNHIDQTFDYSVVDTCVSNSCWGQISVEDKLPPQFRCDPYDTVWCSDTEYILPEDIVFEACGDYKSGKRFITYYYVDDSGTESQTCTTEMCFRRATLADVVMPDDTIFSCDNFIDADPRRTGVPEVDSFPIYPESHFCEINCTYEDQRIDICPESFKILRKWICYDWCQPTSEVNPTIEWQVIKVLDEDPPVVYCPTTERYRDTIGTDVWSCTGTKVLPEPQVLAPNQRIVDSTAIYIISECSEVTYSVRHIAAADPTDCTPEPGVANTDHVRFDRTLNKWIAFDLPLGCNWFYYTFTDECGNYSECSFDIYVEDDVPPVPVCDEHTVVTLNYRGTAKIWAATFDDGSVDNCELDSFDVRRIDPGCDSLWNEFRPYVLFCCDDLGSTVMVELRVWDKAGNTNTCMVEVTVHDKEAPRMIPPPHITIDCRFEYDPDDLTVFGKVVLDENDRESIIIEDPNYAPDYFAGRDGIAWDNCIDITVTDSVEFDLICNVGTIKRHFTAVDPGGLSITRTQIITINDRDIFDESDITWPGFKTQLGCIGIDTDPSNTGVPTFVNEDCSRLASTYDDLVFEQVPDACYKIERTWTVVDWCAFDLGYKEWQWSHKQIIKVTDVIAPVFNSCEKLVFCDDAAYLSRGTCFGAVDITPDVEDACTPYDELEIKYRLDEFNTGQYGPWIAGDNLKGDYPVGEHRIEWEVEDGCGNSSRCEHLFEVKDCKAPTPYCRTGIITVLMEVSGEVSVWASDLNIGSFDNCTDESDLIYSFSSDTTDKFRSYTCDSLAGELTITRIVRMYVTDECGNQDYCETTIVIQENGRCPGSLHAKVSGLVTDENDAPMKYVEVRLVDPTTSDILKVTETDENGQYEFDKVLRNNTYEVVPFNDKDHMNGVSTRDLTFIQRDLLGINPLSSPYKRIAADANYSQSMTAGDIAEIRKLILGKYASFSKNLSWRFMPSDYQMADEYNPWGSPESTVITDLGNDVTDINFIGMKTGDVDNSAELNGLGGGNQVRNNETYVVSHSVIALGGNVYRIDFYEDDKYDLNGMQMTINFNNNIEMTSLLSGQMKIDENNFGDQNADFGQLTFSWSEMDGVEDSESSRLMSIIVNSDRNIEEVSLTSDITTAEAYDLGDRILDVTTELLGQRSESGLFTLNQNVPNPFNGSTTISFELPNAQEFVLTFYDPNGRVLRKVDGFGSQGNNSMIMYESDFPNNSGNIIFYQLDTEDNSATRKLIMMK